MRCARCQGCLVRRWERPLWLWCCLNCGDRVDLSIAFQRRQGDMASKRHAVVWALMQTMAKEAAA